MQRIGYHTYHDNPDDALKTGKSKMAVGKLGNRLTVIYKSGQNPYIAYHGSPGVPIRKATTKEVDSVALWRNLQER